jgi:signal transduction histidine kinase
MSILNFKNQGDNRRQNVLELRWILIIATIYLVLFHRPLSATPPIVALFIAAYLGSNILASWLLPKARSPQVFEMAIVAFDATAVSLALLLTQNATSDFFLLYFIVMIIGTLSDRLEGVVATAILISVLHLYTTGLLLGFDRLLSNGLLIRIPFLFVVALFFGHLVQRARSAEREAKEARDHEMMRNDFVGGVVHDLKIPLTIIKSWAEMMLKDAGGSLSDEHADLTRRIHVNAQRMLRLALNLLDSSRIDAGRLDLQREPVRLTELVQKTISSARTASELKKISLDFRVPENIHAIVEVDEVQMERVIWNLLDNAIKNTPENGAVTISIDSQDDRLGLSISDSGPGVPARQLSTIFERYKAAPRGHFASSGFGLFIVKSIVQAHGGTVEASNLPGGGARFVVRLPSVEQQRSKLPNRAANVEQEILRTATA